MYPIILLLVAIIAASIHLYLSKKRSDFKRIIEVLLAYMIPLNVGVGALIGFIANTFFGSEVAGLLRWPPGNPFQLEVAGTNLAIGIVGLLCIWQRRGFWMATAIISSLYFFGAAYGRFYLMFHGGQSPYTTYPILYVGDIIIPLIYLVLTYVYASQNKFFKET